MNPSSPRIFLTGGTGFFGRALLRYWDGRAVGKGTLPEVTVLSRSPQDFLRRHPEFQNLGWLSFHQGDVLEPASLPSGNRYSHVLHAATDSTFGPRLAPMERYDQIVSGTRNMLDFAIRCEARRFLLTSSGGVYGPQPADLQRIPESFDRIADPLDPANAYCVGKRVAEHLCALYQDRFPVETVVARGFAFVGRDLPLDAHFAIGNFIRDAVGSGPIVVHGDGLAVRSYLDQRDLAEWLQVILERGAAGRAYNVGSDQAITVGSVARLVRDTLAPGKEVVVLGRTGDAPARNRYVPDISRARSEFGLDVSVSLRDAIAEAGRAAREHAPGPGQ